MDEYVFWGTYKGQEVHYRVKNLSKFLNCKNDKLLTVGVFSEKEDCTEEYKKIRVKKNEIVWTDIEC